MKIYILKDEAGIRSYYRYLLGRRYSLEFCETSEVFLDSLKTSNCDLLIIDTGLELSHEVLFLIKKLKGSGDYARIPVLSLSESNSRNNKELLFSAGADYFLQKPVDKRVILDTIEMLIKRNNLVSAAS